MPSRRASALFGVMFVAASYVAYSAGGGGDRPRPPPRPAAGSSQTSPTAAPSTAPGDDAYVESLRLVDGLASARIDVPSLERALPHLETHWRKMPLPWSRLPRDVAPLAMLMAFRTTPSEVPWSVPTTSGGRWNPDARTWNMNEGSFDQREAIFAPTPSTLRFRVTVPVAGRLDIAPAVARELEGTAVFVVSLVDMTGTEHEVYRHRIQPGEAGRWFDARIDLARYVGQSVELVLRTSQERPNTGKRRRAVAKDPEPGADGDAGSERVAPPIAIAFWGSPTLLGKRPAPIPYNVLWITVDALRSDVMAGGHDDEDDRRKREAPYPPLEAWLPKMPGITPNIDAIAARGVRFTRAYSAASWTRPGTLAMLSGMRSSELGVDTLAWVVPPSQAARYYASSPPLLPLLLRANQVTAQAIVNNFFMVGYAAVGLDMGFERLVDHRYRSRDTLEITRDAVAWLAANADRRFFLFVNYNSPHAPYDPPAELLGRIPPPPVGPADPNVRRYLAEAAKDDEAIGILTKTLDELGLTSNTLVVVTADHGETLSSAHGGVQESDRTPVRFHHAAGCFEETTRIPMVMALPGKLDGGKVISAPVRSTDLAPTVLDLEGLEVHPRMSGKSLLPLVRGVHEPDPRVVVSEGRGMRAILWGQWRLIVREGGAQRVSGYGRSGAIAEELFDLDEDPGERHDVASARPEVVAEMRARLAAALENVPAAGTISATARAEPGPVVHLRFAGGGEAHRVSGKLVIGEPGEGRPPLVQIEPVNVPREAFRIDGKNVEIALTTAPDGIVGLDLRVDPPGEPIAWSLYLDDAPWPDRSVFVGPFGLLASAATGGLQSDEARAEVQAPFLPEISPVRDLGLFVTRDLREDLPERSPAPGPEAAPEAAREMDRILRDWGYAHGGIEK